MAENDPRSEASKKRDLISRGDHSRTPLGSSLFVILRTLDPLLQYSLLSGGIACELLHRIGLPTLPQGLPAVTGIPVIDNLGLSPYRLILMSMAIGSMVKQNIWLLAVSGEPMPVFAAVMVAVYNTTVNTLNNVLFLLPFTSASKSTTFPQLPLIVGATMYTVGITAELVSEIQRKRFKADPKNKGKAYTGGLWSLARHINYGGYSVWRAGYALAAGGWTWGTVILAAHLWNFATRGVPILDEYCSIRYGEQWAKFKRDVPSQLIPGIF